MSLSLNPLLVDEFTGDFNSRTPFMENVSGSFGKPNYFDQVSKENRIINSGEQMVKELCHKREWLTD